MFNLPNNQRNANYNFYGTSDWQKSRHIALNVISGLWKWEDRFFLITVYLSEG